MNTNAENNPSSQGFSKPSKDTADASASASHAWRISSFEDIRDLPASSVVPEEPSKARRSPACSKKKPAREYTVGEEIANSISHGIGAALAVAAIPICVVISVSHGGGVALAAALIYTISMLLEYLASTLYHALVPLPAKKVFKVLDHSAIYLFIAGSYTPFCLITLANSNGLLLCIGVWALAIVGIAFEAFWVYRPRWISAVIYLLLGWCVVGFLPALISSLAFPGLMLLLAGGICYSIGCVFYVLKKIPYMHTVFHLWVLAGSILQFLSIVLYVL
ncbi:hemolysin III family protein [uncultured Slackia sp.]|uniref:PAQR family membrane homeostasis protein TrhA n=1 Tax=uncultured Slackia sp. TaxID=665903 RepID=UPI00280AAB4F|nr:hemolysin III family protein [uncultured Slackia sp.]